MKKTVLILLLTILTLLCACGEVQKNFESLDGQSTETRLTVALPAPGTTGDITLPETIPEELLESLKNYLNKQTFTNALYYVDLETGFTISYNPDRIFAAASLVKAPYLMYILDMVNKKELALTDTIKYKASLHKFGGTGKVQYMSDGTVLTLAELIEYAAVDSDNTAFKMMYTTIISVYDFHLKAQENYNAPYQDYRYTGNVCNAGGVARMFKNAYEQMKAGDEMYTWLIELLKNANENKFINCKSLKDNGIVVAHKYGKDHKASNDAAIVFYGDRPYLLVLLTDYLNIHTDEFMNETSEKILKIHQALCGE